MAGNVTRQADRSQKTRAALISAGRELFADHGYADIGTEEIVRRAAVTRGALYHHFADKRALFQAVHEEIEAELAERIGSQLLEAATDDPVGALALGIRAFLDACTEPGISRIALVDAPSVLGWAEWRRVEERYGLGLISAGLSLGMDGGALRTQLVTPLAHLMLAALTEAAMMLAHAEDQASTRAELENALLDIVDGLRA